MSEVSRQSRRYPATQALNVRCESWGTFTSFYAADVSQGGMFIVTDAPLRPLEYVDVILELPEGHRIELQARVVHVVDEASARAEGVQPGAGVEFCDLDPVRKEQIRQLVEFARWEGSSGQGSYAKAIFDSAPSVPPSELFRESQPAGAVPTRKADPKSTSGVHMRAESAEQPRVQVGTPEQAKRATKRKRNESRQRPRASQPSAPPGSRTSTKSSRAPAAKSPELERKHAEHLKLALTHIAHKRDTQARGLLAELLTEDPKHREAQQWLLTLDARERDRRGQVEGAIKAYEQILGLDEGHHEARTYIRKNKRRLRLGKLPFGNLFSKKG